MKIALAQFNPTIGDFGGNAARILSLAGQAKQRGADLAVFTELFAEAGFYFSRPIRRRNWNLRADRGIRIICSKLES